MLLGLFRPLEQGISNASREKRTDGMSKIVLRWRKSLPGRKVRHDSQPAQTQRADRSIGGRSVRRYFVDWVELARACRRP